MSQKISAMARDAFWQYADKARKSGKDLAEVLDREGYLLTGTRLVKIQADTIDEIAELLETTSPNWWVARNANLTPNDLQREIAARLRSMAKDRRKWDA